MNRRLAGVLIAAISLLTPGFALAQAYPDKPIRLVVPHPPSASTDVLGRMVAQKMSASIDHAVVVNNHSGASGNIGSELVAKAATDGYTFKSGQPFAIAVTSTARYQGLPNVPTMAESIEGFEMPSGLVVVGGTPAEFAITVKRDFELLGQADPKKHIKSW